MKFAFAAFCLLLNLSLLAAPKKIISLAPHTTEMLFALDAGDQLVAASDFSDYPEAAQKLPRVANYQGVNFEQILRIQPDLIVAWRGGNKPQDLARLASLGFKLFYSAPKKVQDIADEMLALAMLIEKPKLGKHIHQQLSQRLQQIKQKYRRDTPIKTFYYMWSKPLMTIGSDAWANQLLSNCGATNIFADAPTDYPQVTVEQVLKRKPQVLIAATKSSKGDAETTWHSWRTALKAPLQVVNPDRLHRFTPRLFDGLEDLCQKLHLSESSDVIVSRS